MSASAGAGRRWGEAAGDVVGVGPACCPAIYGSIIRGRASGGWRGSYRVFRNKNIPTVWCTSSACGKPLRP